MNVILDTSFLLGLFDHEDVHHAEARRQFSVVADATFLIPAIVVAETLIQQEESLRLLDACKHIVGSFLPITEQELRAVAQFPQTLRRKLKANDCVVLAHVRTNHAELFTFDRRLRKACEQIRE